MPAGLWVGTRYWFDWANSSANRRFVDAFHQQHGRYPSYNAQNAYTGLHLLAQAINQTGTLDPVMVIHTLEGMAWEAPMGPLVIRPEDHQANAAYPFRSLQPVWTFAGADITPSPEIHRQVVNHEL